MGLFNGWWNWRDRTPGKQPSDMDVGLKVMFAFVAILIILLLLVVVDQF